MNIIRTLFVLRLSKHSPGPVPALWQNDYSIAKTTNCFPMLIFIKIMFRFFRNFFLECLKVFTRLQKFLSHNFFFISIFYIALALGLRLSYSFFAIFFASVERIDWCRIPNIDFFQLSADLLGANPINFFPFWHFYWKKTELIAVKKLLS